MDALKFFLTELKKQDAFSNVKLGINMPDPSDFSSYPFSIFEIVSEPIKERYSGQSRDKFITERDYQRYILPETESEIAFHVFYKNKDDFNLYRKVFREFFNSQREEQSLRPER